MAKRDGLPVLPDNELPDDVQHTFENDMGDDAIERLYAMLGSSDSTLKIALYRALPNSRKQAYLCAIDAEEFSLDEIKRRFGGGDFVVKGYDERSKLRINQTVTIEGDPVALVPALPQMTASPATAPLDMGAMLQLMHENNKALLSGLSQILQPPPQPSRADFLAEMAQMRSIFVSDAPRENGIDGIMKGIELARSITPKEGGTDGMDVLLEAVKSLAPVITTAMTKNERPPQRTAPAHPQQIAAQPVNSILTQAQPAPVPVSVLPEADDNMMLKFYLGILVGYAEQDRDTSLYAEVVMDNVPEEKLQELLAMPDPVAHLGAIHPDVLAHRDWFQSLINETKSFFELTEPDIAGTVGQNLPEKSTENAPETASNSAINGIAGRSGGNTSNT